MTTSSSVFAKSSTEIVDEEAHKSEIAWAQTLNSCDENNFNLPTTLAFVFFLAGEFSFSFFSNKSRRKFVEFLIVRFEISFHFNSLWNSIE